VARKRVGSTASDAGSAPSWRSATITFRAVRQALVPNLSRLHRGLSHGTMLAVLIVSGTVARLVISFAFEGVTPDIDGFRYVGGVLAHQPLDVYTLATPGRIDWAYPGGYLPVAYAAYELSHATALPFYGLFKLPAVGADAALAWLVQWDLGRRGVDELRRLAAAALIALGPSFVAVSGLHGQFDSVAVLPAVAALVIWEGRGEQRAGLAGLLVGIGGAFKSYPLLMLLALVPSARSKREVATLVLCALAVPLISIAPFLARDADPVVEAVTGAGQLGYGGIGLVVQPGFMSAFLADGRFEYSSLNVWLQNHGTAAILLPALVALAVFLLRERPRAYDAAVLLWLTVFVFGVLFSPQYLVLGLPFFVLATHLRWAFALQTLALVPTILFYGGPWGSEAWGLVYTPLMLAMWAGFAVALVVSGRRLVRRGKSPTGRL
jgi:glycosyl transferase family 87